MRDPSGMGDSLEDDQPTKQALSGMLQCEVISEMYFRTFLLKYEVFFKKLH